MVSYFAPVHAQSVGDMRRYLSLLYPDLNQPLAEKEYAGDCRIYTPDKDSKFQNVMDTIHDEFVLAHIIGHFFKALLWRCVKEPTQT